MEVSELVRTLLAKRGIESPEDVSAFLSPDYEGHTHLPFLFRDMQKGVDRVLAAIEKNERIAVYADFDCDGIPGGALLSDLFTKIGHTNVEVYLPHRDREGYGFHNEAIATLASREVKLIITVDVGTTAVEGVRFANEKGIDVIVTDHHDIPEQVPECFALLNPKIAPLALSEVEGYPFPSLCGAGVAFKLAQAVLIEGRKRGLVNFTSIPVGWEKWLLDLVAIATVADMVPLTGENRVLVHWGLQVLRRSRRAGINALCTKLRLRKSELTEDDIGFSIAPRINAASRMDSPDLALKLLTTQDKNEAEDLAAQLEKLNASRKGVLATVVRQARAHVKQRFAEDARIVVLGDPEWKPALLGLAANSIMNDRGGVVCLWGRDAQGRIKGSCRSDGSVSITELFANAGDVFEESGGHAMSGGFSVSHERVHSLPDVLAAASLELAAHAAVEELPHDLLLTLSEVSSHFQEVSKLAPFGSGNPKPIFLFTDTLVTEVKRFGKEKNHVELSLECRKSGARCRAFDFFRAPEDFSHVPVQGESARVLATIGRDSFRGGLALRLVDVLAA